MRYETFTDLRSMSGNDNHGQRSGEIDLDLSKRHRISIKRLPTMPRALRVATGASILQGEVTTPVVQSSSKEAAQDSRPEPSTSGTKKVPSPTPTGAAKPASHAPLPTRIKPNVQTKSVSPPSDVRFVGNPPAKLKSEGAQSKPGPSQVVKSVEGSKVLKNRPKQSSKLRTVESVHVLSGEEADQLLTTSGSAKGKERALESNSSSTSLFSNLKFKKAKLVNEEPSGKPRTPQLEGQAASLKRRRSESSSTLSKTGAKASTSTAIVESGTLSRRHVSSSSVSPSPSPSGSASPRSPSPFTSNLKKTKPSVSADEQRPKKKMRWDMPPPPLPAKCQPPQEEQTQPNPVAPPAQSTSQIPQAISSQPISLPEASSSTSETLAKPPAHEVHPKSKKPIPMGLRAHAEAVPPEQLEPVEGQRRMYDGAIARCPYKCSARERVLACNRCKLFMVSDRLTGKMGELIAQLKAQYPREEDD